MTSLAMFYNGAPCIMFSNPVGMSIKGPLDLNQNQTQTP